MRALRNTELARTIEVVGAEVGKRLVEALLYARVIRAPELAGNLRAARSTKRAKKGPRGTYEHLRARDAGLLQTLTDFLLVAVRPIIHASAASQQADNANVPGAVKMTVARLLQRVGNGGDNLSRLRLPGPC